LNIGFGFLGAELFGRKEHCDSAMPINRGLNIRIITPREQAGVTRGEAV
jgi:hypothetical protein